MKTRPILSFAMLKTGRLVLGAAVVYVLVVGILHSLQRQMVFPGPGHLPKALLSEGAKRVGAEELALATSDGETIYGWHISAGVSRPERRIVVYFHGNASSLLAQPHLQRLLVSRGWDFVGIHYRGYPQSTGSPSEAGLHRDADAAWSFAADKLDTPAGRVVVHGRSLGGGVASQLAARGRAGGLVLESTFTSLVDVAKDHYRWLPVGLLLRDRFETARIAEDFSKPVLVMHGGADRTVPTAHGRALSKMFSKVSYVEVPGVEHNDPLIEGEAATRYFDFLEAAVPREP